MYSCFDAPASFDPAVIFVVLTGVFFGGFTWADVGPRFVAELGTNLLGPTGLSLSFGTITIWVFGAEMAEKAWGALLVV